MIQFKSLKQYTHLVNSITFPTDKKKPFLIVYFGENTDLISDYDKFNFRKTDIRKVIVPVTKIPITRMTPDLKQQYKEAGLLAFSSSQKIPNGQNIIYDMSPYLNSIDSKLKVKNYRQRAGFLIKNLALKIFESFPNNYQKVLLYSVNTNNQVSGYIDRKIFPFILELKNNNIYYDHMILNVVGKNNSNFRLLIKDRAFNFNKVRHFTKNIKILDTVDEQEEKLENSASDIMKKISSNINPENSDKVKAAIKQFLKLNPSELEKINDGKSDNNDANEIAMASILYRSTGDITKAKRSAKNVPADKKTQALKAIDKKYADELLTPKPVTTTSENIYIQQTNIAKAVGNKSPDHIFEKRQIDFETNLKKDIRNSFKVLETKSVPLKIENIKMIPIPQRAGEIRKSDLATFEVTLVDKFKRKHVVRINVPMVQKDGTFTINGRKKCLINQLILCPITFPKQFDSKFESSYSTFHIWSKRTKREEYLEAYIGSYKVPLLILLAFSFGFKETMKLYDIKYKIVDEKPEKDTPFISRLGETSWVVFENINSKLKEELCQSFIHSDVFNKRITKEFPTKDYFNDLIIKIAGRINSTFLIQSNLENILDPVAKQVLVNQQLPHELNLIMKYMASKTVEGYTQKRNDISNQRIRNSEVLVHLAQKQILAAYTEYKEQVLSGNKKANFDVSQTKVLSDFVNTEIVADMEYANPVEEMATKTRVSPVGKTVGGIPDKQAIQNSGRNVHDSMFGNIDTLDTPEGENVGIVQQLTVDAFITSARGLIHTKDKKEGQDSGLLSTTSSQIPFVENNDGNRVMFGCSQSRQSVPLKNPEPPMIQTGYESILTSVLSDAFVKKAPCTGKIIKITEDEIIIKCTNGGNKTIDISPVHLRSGSGKDTLSVFNTIIKEGQAVKQGAILAEGSCVTQGTISLGRSLCVALMPWKGFNFEDGIVISESLVKDDKLTSLHGIEEEIMIDKDDRISFINSVGNNTKKGEPLIRKTIGEIEQLIGFDEEEEGSEIVSGQFIKKSPGGKIVEIEVFSNVKDTKFPELAELSQKTRKKYKMKGNEKFSNGGEVIPGVLIKFKIEQEMPIGIGDKLTNRHGAKGIVALIEKEENMPISPTGDRVDIILNPIGVIGRMNVGQLYELYSGLICKEMGRRIIKLDNKPKVIALLKQVLPLLDMTKNKEFSKNLINNFRAMSATKFKTFMDQIKKSGSMTLLVPPFKAPAYKEILAALKVLGLKAGYKLKLPEYGTNCKSNVAVGYMYMLKLEHIGKDKLHARSTGPVTSKTFQPTGGKRRDGGQRMGELDTYSFISYNCPTLLSEFFGPLSDDHGTKNEIIGDIIEKGSAEFRVPKQSPVKDLLNSYFISLMIGR